MLIIQTCIDTFHLVQTSSNWVSALGGGCPPRWAESPVRLLEGRTILESQPRLPRLTRLPRLASPPARWSRPPGTTPRATDATFATDARQKSEKFQRTQTHLVSLCIRTPRPGGQQGNSRTSALNSLYSYIKYIYSFSVAITSISRSTFNGSADTATQDLAGL